jgi:hypothetical protein
MRIFKKKNKICPINNIECIVKSSNCKECDEYLEPIHSYFELTYAQYLVTPRSLLQSMSSEWQQKFVILMRELDNSFSEEYQLPKGLEYTVILKDEKGKIHSICEDTCHIYDRGRRIIPRIK